MIFSLSVWEIFSCIILLVVLWLVMRYLATYMFSAVHYFFDRPVQVNPFINGVKYPVSYWTERGGRPYQEDRHEEMKGGSAGDSSLYGVYDGHGGYRAAQYCKDYLLKCIASDAEFDGNPAKALFRAFFKYVNKVQIFLFPRACCVRFAFHEVHRNLYLP